MFYARSERYKKNCRKRSKKYESDEKWHLHLWKEDDDILGAIGIRIENELNVIIQHISVNPSHRGLGIGKKMVQAIQQQYQNKYAVCPTDETKTFYEAAMEEEQD
ncbi:GNAT family N-acetyltransferase [Virgibacillus halophilus]|uniref:GNAT family N-acetyltransferase n=1 Tax=Tigheibacillus halophilus TaxID=361280 RepID=A0ABU5CB22_9BACI|nr:GNAT family N-acetyltransferase [Virgibacillus halophilus]